MVEKETPYLLLADDDGEDREMLSENFSAENPKIRVVACPDGKAALEFLQNCPPGGLPSLMLLDFKMPFMTAAEVLEALGRDDRYANIPKIVWSTSNNPLYVDACMRHGALQYFTKPSGMAELGHIVRYLGNLLRQRHG